jgi:hypothetical protein
MSRAARHSFKTHTEECLHTPRAYFKAFSMAAAGAGSP